MSSELTVVRLELYDGRSGPRLASDVGVSSAGLCVCGGVALRLSDVSTLKLSSPGGALPDASLREPLGSRNSDFHGEGDEGVLCEPSDRKASTLACDVSVRAGAGRVAVVVEEGMETAARDTVESSPSRRVARRLATKGHAGRRAWVSAISAPRFAWLASPHLLLYSIANKVLF